MPLNQKQRKIIHVDMDCFYAAIEIRDNPSLANKPVAVGGSANQRGVLCTCNYIARKSGVRSAMATATALRHCPDLVLLPVNMPKYREVAKRVHAIFKTFTPLVEPLSLDEAYLDVTHVDQYRGSATLMAKAIRYQIWESEKLIASAGVAPNKFLAKIASGWKKPNGLFVIQPHEIPDFVETLPVDELYGVGHVTAQKLHDLGLKTCKDLQQLSLVDLVDQFGKFGQRLYEQSRGIDYREVEPDRIRKSMSVEQTFMQDLPNQASCFPILEQLYHRLIKRLEDSGETRRIKNQYFKIKFSDFTIKTAEIAVQEINLENYFRLFREVYGDEERAVRLLGLGVHFVQENEQKFIQASLF